MTSARSRELRARLRHLLGDAHRTITDRLPDDDVLRNLLQQLGQNLLDGSAAAHRFMRGALEIARHRGVQAGQVETFSTSDFGVHNFSSSPSPKLDILKKQKAARKPLRTQSGPQLLIRPYRKRFTGRLVGRLPCSLPPKLFGARAALYDVDVIRAAPNPVRELSLRHRRSGLRGSLNMYA